MLYCLSRLLKRGLQMAAQIVGILIPVFAVLSLQCKNMRLLLALQIISNGLLMLNFALLDAWSGALTAILATVQTIIIFIFRVSNKKIPVFVIILFMASFITGTIITYTRPLDIIPCVAAFIFVFSIIQTKASVCRVYSLLNTILWIIYDIGSGAWTTIITHVLLLGSAIVGIMRHDIGKKRRNKVDNCN